MQTKPSEDGKTLEVLYRISTVLICLLSATLALMFISYALIIYFSGDPAPYTRERIGDALSAIFPVALVFVITVIETAVLSSYMPEKRVKPIPVKLRVRYRLAVARMGDRGSLEYRARIAEEERYRRTRTLLFLIPSSVIALATLILISVPSLYSGESVNEDVARSAVIAFAAFLVITSGAYLLLSMLDRSYLRAIEAVKSEWEKCGMGTEYPFKTARPGGHAALLLRFAIIILSVSFIVIGALGGEAGDVLGKAVRICTECIGLG